MATFEDEIARIHARMDTAGPRLQGLFANLNRALSTIDDWRGVLLAFEEMLIESLDVNAGLLQQRGDIGGARECLELVQRLRDLVQGAIEPDHDDH